MNLEEQLWKNKGIGRIVILTKTKETETNTTKPKKKKKTIILEISNAIQLKYIYVPFHPYEPLTMQSRSTNAFQNCN